MSFSPLPKTFLEVLRRSRQDRVVEIGCADGSFSTVLADLGVRPVRLDRRPPWVGSIADIVADAAALPLASDSVSVLVCANLLHYLWPPAGTLPVPADWLRCLRRDGYLFIFEDEPLDAPAPARNYRDLQDFLVRLDPAGRGPLLPRAHFESRLRAAGDRPGCWRLGWQRNRWPVDAERVASWLEGDRTNAQGAAGRLAEAIRHHGLDYGCYWWACWSPERISR